MFVATDNGLRGERVSLDERFRENTLDREVWFPYYLPHWSSRAESAATYDIRDGELHLTIPADQLRWCSETHLEPLRVSCLQTGSFAGPVGSAIGQQPFREGLEVLEEQPAFSGYTPRYGRVEIRMRGVVTSRSMCAFWMSGFEDQPERSGEICIAEVFGDGVGVRSAEVGIGVHRFRDPALMEEFATKSLAIDPAQFHTYGVEWRPASLVFTVDGDDVGRLSQAPDYPMQLMIGVFDFPERTAPVAAKVAVPELVVSHVRGQSLD